MSDTEKLQQQVLAAAVKSACEAMELAEIEIAHLRVEVEYWKAKALGVENG